MDIGNVFVFILIASFFLRLIVSFHYSCRRWYLRSDPLLRYQHLYAFENAMLQLEAKYSWLNYKVLGIKYHVILS